MRGRPIRAARRHEHTREQRGDGSGGHL